MQTWNADRVEKDSKRKSAIITIAINVLMLLAFYFIVVWQEQIPPLPTYGLELNLGFTDTGSGNRNSPNAPSETPSESVEQAAPGEVAKAVTQPAAPAPSPKTETAKPKTSSKPATNKAVTTNPSPIKGEEKAAVETKKPEPTKAEPTKTVTTPAKSEAEQTTQKAPEKPKIDPRAVMGAGGTSGKSTTPASGGAQGSSNAKGDEGKPTGTVDGRAIMGEGSGKGTNSGAGNGPAFDLDGWGPAYTPDLNDPYQSHNGEITFNITVDLEGKVIQAVLLTSNITGKTLDHYRNLVKQIRFKKIDGKVPPEFSKGKVTFYIRNN